MTQGMIGALCRAGFESECGQELMAVAAEAGLFGYFQSSRNSGWVLLLLPDPQQARTLMSRVNWEQLVFAREWFLGLALVSLPESDRVSAVLEALKEESTRGQGPLGPFSRLEIQVPDSDRVSGDVQQFARKWTAPLSRALRQSGRLVEDSESPRLDLVLSDFDEVFMGLTFPGNRSPYLGGIPRLRMPASAPSRSTLKLEEAWKLFIPEDQWLSTLGNGAQAVDLGAAPGGWTWQLVEQGMMVHAVDNGPMDPALMASGHVTHVQEDAFSWRPRRAVDWLVCDIADKPARVTALMGLWLTQGLCRHCLFNLKLPMKQRWETWLECRERLEQTLRKAGLRYRIRARHLYHDREEITCYVQRLD
ncbi:MAG: 23S rRNA (cytidine(2498)-2'-O)-methyltransferase RlmM [Oleiphilaceae bacterium]|nr:23S rRNA (cytidine(2498)-2'-O)-methyltransferase RlmM [Oleiphilaceae bacterium]